MFRYLALIWNPSDPSAAQEESILSGRIHASSTPWHVALKNGGLAVFVTGTNRAVGNIYRLEDGHGVVLGTLFHRNREFTDDTVPEQPIFTPLETSRIHASSCRHLIERYWGWYVAYVRHPGTHTKWVLRGPMSDLPCLHTHCRGVTIFCSLPEDIDALDRADFSIDWSYVSLQAGFGHSARIGESAIRELSSVERGECLEFRGNHPHRTLTYWNPCEAAKSPPLDCVAAATEAVRATVKSSVGAWASRHDAALVRLSGGLDSSIVLTCLAERLEGRVTPFNYFHEGAHADERVFARAAADTAGCELVESAFGIQHPLSIVSKVRRTAAPVLDFSDWQQHSWEHALARDRRATGIFTGSLGDVLFDKTANTSAAADYLRTKGPGLGFLKTVSDVALNRRLSVWHVACSAIRDGWIHVPEGTWDSYQIRKRRGIVPVNAILTSDARESALERDRQHLIHPWLRDVSGVPIGKVWMISALFVEGFYDAHFKAEGDPPIIAPFISQPLTELCLRVPSYLNMRDGWDRSIERQAFADVLPESIIRRSTKGSPGAWLKDVVERNAHFIREFLLDGLLVREQVLDAVKLEGSLPGAATRSAAHGGVILNLLYTEAWVRAWSARAAPSDSGRVPVLA